MAFLLTGVPALSYGEQRHRVRNTLIGGDNLLVLAALPAACVDLIYTDPPYSTGKRFRFNDRWKAGTARLTEGPRSTDQGGGHHAAWIDFMARRIRLMKRSLKPAGVMAISIGKEELFRLGLLMDEIFGEENRLGIINWQKTYAPANGARHLADTTDYVLVYARKRTARTSAPVPAESGFSLWGGEDPCFDENRLKIGAVPLMPFPHLPVPG